MRSNQRKMRVIVSRYLRRANQLIANVERGLFPVYKNVQLAEPRFSRSQVESHGSLEEAWWHTAHGFVFKAHYQISSGCQAHLLLVLQHGMTVP